MLILSCSNTKEIGSNFIENQKNLALYLIEKITDISIEYLTRQIDSGADFIQVFDSWAGLLNDRQYEQFIIQPSIKINREINWFFYV